VADSLNHVAVPTKRTKCLGIKRETARPKSMRRGVLISSRGDRRWIFPNDIAGQDLLWLALMQTVDFTADMFFQHGGA
jgi:hypothetical protein